LPTFGRPTMATVPLRCSWLAVITLDGQRFYY
jgi:hypothetical protein